MGWIKSHLAYDPLIDSDRGGEILDRDAWTTRFDPFDCDDSIAGVVDVDRYRDGLAKI